MLAAHRKSKSWRVRQRVRGGEGHCRGRADLVFLDVQMPKLDGFEVLELIEPRARGHPSVIFVTAYDQYAMRAFDAHAVDYLLKPFSAERFERALERARRGWESGSPRRNWRGKRARRRAAATAGGADGTRVHVIPLEKLDYAEAQDDYVALHSGGKSYLKQQTIGASRRCSTRRGSCAYTAPRLSTWSAWRASSRTRKRPGGDSQRRHAAAGEPLGLRAAAGSHGRFAGQPQYHAVRPSAGPAWRTHPLRSAPEGGGGRGRGPFRGCAARGFGVEGVFHGDGNRCAGSRRAASRMEPPSTRRRYRA